MESAARHAAGNTPARPDNTPEPERRLRLGYVSPDFMPTPPPVTWCRCSNPTTTTISRFIATRASHNPMPSPGAWPKRPITGTRARIDNEKLAEQIRRDRTDILVDLSLHMGQNRLLLFARKPAPVQVTWLAYPGSTGLDAIDYRMTDPRPGPTRTFRPTLLRNLCAPAGFLLVLRPFRPTAERASREEIGRR